MACCYSNDHIARDQHAILRNYNGSTALEQSIKDYWGLKLVLKIIVAANPRPLLLQWFKIFGLHERVGRKTLRN